MLISFTSQIETILGLKCIFTGFFAFKKSAVELKPSQKHSNKTDGIHYLVPNMLKVDILQTKFCFLEQQTLCLCETFRSACLYFICSFPTQAFLAVEEGIVKCLRDSYWTVKTFKSVFKTVFAFPSMHLSILIEMNLLVTSSSFSHCVSQCTFNTQSPV